MKRKFSGRGNSRTPCIYKNYSQSFFNGLPGCCLLLITVRTRFTVLRLFRFKILQSILYTIKSIITYESQAILCINHIRIIIKPLFNCVRNLFTCALNPTLFPTFFVIRKKSKQKIIKPILSLLTTKSAVRFSVTRKITDVFILPQGCHNQNFQSFNFFNFFFCLASLFHIFCVRKNIL